MNIVFARKNLFSKMPQNGEVSLSRTQKSSANSRPEYCTYNTLTFIDLHLAGDGLIVKGASPG